MSKFQTFNGNDEDENETEQKYAHLLNSGNENHSVLENNSGKASRCKWTDEEVESFLGIIQQMKLQSPLQRSRNAKVFKVISREMARKNCSKSPKQLKMKYHQMRRQYVRARNSGESFDHFEAIHELMQGNDGSDLEGDLESDSDGDGENDEDHFGPISETEGDDALDASCSSININARCRWAEGEVDLLLDLIHSLGLRSALLRKRNAKVFKLLAKEMAKRNCNKGADKLRIKFQLLRRMYNKAKNGSGETFEHFEAMRQVLDPTEEEAAAEAEAEGHLSSGSESEFNDSDDEEGDASQKFGAHFWTDEEVDSFLLIIRDNGFFRALDGSRKRNFQTLAHISNILAKQAIKRTPHQLRNKLRLLFKRHREAKEHGLQNVRILPRHFKLFDELIQAPRENRKNAIPRPARHIKSSLSKQTNKSNIPLESDSENSDSSCDLLRAAAESEDYEDVMEMEAEPTPIEALTAIMEGQKQLLTQIKAANESFLRQQREQQQQFLAQISEVMRRDREETLRRINEMLTPK
ncbi:zinc finger and SCAN domain-containing protein 29 [Drosophila ficusphila]|uniref:zinc finger and SCAN domain-containing protein 29 n=1 Tax=Drosophila ficusphila TaxID=30025 RepID=UPI0007E70F0A|nr:zinc finger and SCAN domain-containing protein 29 [Drosophila ficusphila]